VASRKLLSYYTLLYKVIYKVSQTSAMESFVSPNSCLFANSFPLLSGSSLFVCSQNTKPCKLYCTIWLSTRTTCNAVFLVMSICHRQ